MATTAAVAAAAAVVAVAAIVAVAAAGCVCISAAQMGHILLLLLSLLLPTVASQLGSTASATTVHVGIATTV
jgi:hypothetical protein